MSSKNATRKGDTKTKDKSKVKDPPGTDEGSSEAAHPEYLFPLVLTSVTQELFGCRADEDVTAENPYKLLKKEEIIQDMKNRAAVCDFSPVKQTVLDYPEEELLLVFDRDFTYGQSFYLVLTVQAKESILKPPVTTDGEEALEHQEEEEVMPKTPEPHPWVSLGSEMEIEEELLIPSRARLSFRITPLSRHSGEPVLFSDYDAQDNSTVHVECPSYEDKNFSIRRMERDTSVQNSTHTTHSSTQTLWKHPKNMCTQYEAREFSLEEREGLLKSENLKNFISSVAPRFEVCLQQNLITDVFTDDWTALYEDDGSVSGKTDSQLKEYQTFMDLHFSKEKSVSSVHWHPTLSGVMAVSMMERASLEERIESSTRLLLNPSCILFWSFSDPIHPQLQLECPDDILCFQFCPSDPNILAAGCVNGQVVLWDITAHAERLQDTRRGGKNTSSEPIKTSMIPVVRYCAVSGIEHGHKAPITDLQWLPETFEVSRLGLPVENSSGMSVQLVSCAPDCCVLFWDLRLPRVVSRSMTDVRQKSVDKPLENPHGVPNTFKHLNLTWKPFIRVSLPKMGSSGEYSPLRLSMRENTLDYSTGGKAAQEGERKEGCGFSQLRVPSAKQPKVLENISTKLYVGTEDGELVYVDWKVEKDGDSGRLLSSKPLHQLLLQDSQVRTISRSPFFRDILLVVSSFSFSIWKEGLTIGPLIRSPYSKAMCTAGHWSQSRPAVFFIGKEDGNIDIYDLLQNTHEATQSQSICTAAVTCIRTSLLSSKQHLLAVSDHLGTLHILQIPWTLRKATSSERQNVQKYLEKEQERLMYFEKRQENHEKEKKEMDAELKRKKMEVLVPLKQLDVLEAEALKEYEQYVAMEKLLLKSLGVRRESEEAPEQ